MNLIKINTARWIEILSPAGDVAIIDDLWKSKLIASRGKNRAWVVACLNGVCWARRNADSHVLAGVLADTADFISPNMIPAPAARGSEVAEAVWLTYLRYACGDAPAAQWLADACHALDPTALHTTTADNPEPWWQNEMLILQALHSYALLSHDAGALEKTLACADFHLREIQPDHATNEPWSIHAYACHANGNVTAETLLHAAMIQGGGDMTPVAKLVAADALAALRAAV